ncbi:MAG: Small Arf-related GTPase [Promethearchaeota archaeon]|nr:MAG: Small Arf-related GTPase [Candidatus Lokiarchaeota archaeon]
MEDTAKILLTGLDNAGKTSIMVALSEQKGYIEKVMSLTPTTRVDHIDIPFLGKNVVFWDLGGQEKYRKIYDERKEQYFADSSLLLYIIDIQDPSRFETSLQYLDTILEYFIQNYDLVPLVISFHKTDPEIKDTSEVKKNVQVLSQKIINKYEDFELLFQQTTIYDIVSIIKMISYGLAVLNEDFFELYKLLEEYSMNLNSQGLFLLDRNGLIICKYFKDQIEDQIETNLELSVKEHIFELKERKEKGELIERKLFEINNQIRSYLHPIKYRGDEYYISILLNEDTEEN